MTNSLAYLFCWIFLVHTNLVRLELLILLNSKKKKIHVQLLFDVVIWCITKKNGLMAHWVYYTSNNCFSKFFYWTMFELFKREKQLFLTNFSKFFFYHFEYFQLFHPIYVRVLFASNRSFAHTKCSQSTHIRLMEDSFCI